MWLHAEKGSECVCAHERVYEGESDHVSGASEQAMEPDTTTPNLWYTARGLSEKDLLSWVSTCENSFSPPVPLPYSSLASLIGLFVCLCVCV